MISSQKYQLLIQDIRDINKQIKLTKDQVEIDKLKYELSRLLNIKSMYSNIDCTVEAIKTI